MTSTNIFRSKFYKACFEILGEDYGRKLLDNGFNPANFCDLIARKYFIGEVKYSDSLLIVQEVARRLDKEGMHGLIEG